MRVQQLYCTHCTYGTSALEQRRGELAGETLGYSVRAGSLSGEDLRRLYRHVERHMSYHLPGDTPPERKLRLDAATAPRRLMFVPAADGSAILAQVCYRTTDTAGRPGSYFAHALVGQPDASGNRWTALEAIRTWNSPQWVTSDHDRIPARLAEYDSLAAWSNNGQQPQAVTAAVALDDAAVLAFLRGDEVHGLLPERLADVPAEKRRQLLAAALERHWEVLGGRADSLVLLAEPALAALVFYALLRLTPPEACGRAVGFSTFEPTPERATTLLAATCHDDPRRDLPPECYRAGYHVVSTVEPFRTTPLRGEAARYPALMLDRLHAAGWSGVDAVHIGFRAVGAGGPPQWERLAQAHDEAARLLGGNGQSVRLPENAPPFVQDYLRRVVIELLNRPGADERVRSLDASTHAALLRLIGHPESAQAESALAVLLDHLPDAEAPRFLKDGRQSLERRRTVALRHLRTHGRWPDGVPLRPLLPMLLGGLSADELTSLHAHLPPPQRAEFLTVLLECRAGNPAADRLLTAAVDAPDDDALCRRLDDAPFPAILRSDSPAGQRLRQRLSQMIAELRSDPVQGVPRLAALERAADALGESERQAVRKWAELRDALTAATDALGEASVTPHRSNDDSISGHGENGPWAALYKCLARTPIPTETTRELDSIENWLEKRLRMLAVARRNVLLLLDDIGKPHELWFKLEPWVQAEVIIAAADKTFMQFVESDFGRQFLTESGEAVETVCKRLRCTLNGLVAEPACFRNRLEILNSDSARALLDPSQLTCLDWWNQIAEQLDALRKLGEQSVMLSCGECPEELAPKVSKIGQRLGMLFTHLHHANSLADGEPRDRSLWRDLSGKVIAHAADIRPDQPPQFWEAFDRSYSVSDTHPGELSSRVGDRGRPPRSWLPEKWHPGNWLPARWRRDG